MGEKTKISWADHTFNPWRGCTKIAAGCDNCYAERMAKRNPAVLGEWGDDGTRALAAEAYWRLPEKWNADAGRDGVRRRVFVGSLMDVFEDRLEWVDERARLFEVICDCLHLDWLLLTKRPRDAFDILDRFQFVAWPHLWLGTSASTHADANANISALLAIPAVVRFLSLEPLLEEVDLRTTWDEERMFCGKCGHVGKCGDTYEVDSDTPDDPDEEWPICPECGGTNLGGFASYASMGVWPLEDRPFPPLDWVIVGCESGPGARPCKLEWLRSIRDQCRDAGVPLFVKQLEIAGRVVKDVEQFPEDLQIQEFPNLKPF